MNGSAIMTTPEITSHTFSLTEGYSIDNPIPAPHLSPFKAYQTLSVFIFPSGSSAVAGKILKEKSDNHQTQTLPMDNIMC
jgi:hypothetical protein